MTKEGNRLASSIGRRQGSQTLPVCMEPKKWWALVLDLKCFVLSPLRIELKAVVCKMHQAPFCLFARPPFTSVSAAYAHNMVVPHSV